MLSTNKCLSFVCNIVKDEGLLACILRIHKYTDYTDYNKPIHRMVTLYRTPDVANKREPKHHLFSQERLE